ncbi:MAG: hypothetical protein ACLP1X_23195 [Polyangiaceae bacterium]
MTSAGANSEPLSDGTPDSYPTPPESDCAEPLDPDVDPELDPELLVLDPDPELDPESVVALSWAPPPDDDEQAATAKATAAHTGRCAGEWSRTR